MDLELTDEQRWLAESVGTLLDREWVVPEALGDVTLARRRRVWDKLRSFGALSIGGPDGIGAVECCLIARALGVAPRVGALHRECRGPSRAHIGVGRCA